MMVPSAALVPLAVPARHLVRFYRTEAQFASGVGGFLAEGLERGERLVIIVTPPHRELLLAHLEGRGFDAEVLIGAGRLDVLDAEETLAALLVDGRPDRARFQAKVVPRVVRATAFRQGVRAFGEMVDLLTRRGQGDAAMSLEALWDEALAHLDFTLLCAYHLGAVDAPGVEAMVTACQAHGARLGDDPGDGVEDALLAACGEVLEARAQAALLRLIDAVVPPTEGLTQGERRLLWLRRNLPGLAEDVRAATKRRLGEAL